jgi:polyhydroxybutyrate depolymerase
VARLKTKTPGLPPRQPGIDDVGFLTALADKFIAEVGTDRNRVFAVGLSEGGYMATRLALEAPRFRALASVEANLPAPENFQCKPVTQGSASIILIHGTKDRLVPFEGGEGSLIFGLLKNPKVLSSRDGFGIERSIWSNDSGAEVELMVIDGAGHTFPQPYYRARRILGPSPRDPNAAEVIWAFFERQRPRQ